jgi:hypothetical protein
VTASVAARSGQASMVGRRGTGLVLVGALGCIQVAACSTTYQPRSSGRVGLAVRHGGAMFIKNGKEVPAGPFTGELEALVAETPAAASHARTAHTQFLIGIPAYLTGAVGIVVGVAALSGPIGWVVIGAGATSLGTGLGFMGAGFTHVVDAVSIHNDAVSPSR